jgi:homoserine dehydrogenase
VRGILNGTSNFVISHLERGATLEDALKAARDCGLAEADFSRDLDGRDAAAKLSIIAWIAFGITPSSLHLRRTPLLPGIERLVRCAAALGGRVRLIAECTRLEDETVVASVEPVIVPESSAFARTTLEDNRVEVDLGWSSPLSVSGPGAGGAPTAAALLSDLVRNSPPPNDRGEGAAKFESVSDTRDHRWVITADLDRQALPVLAARLDVPCSLIPQLGDQTAVVTRSTNWKRVQHLLNTLESVGASPAVARFEFSEFAEVTE